jgi:hypothetical protein
VVKAVQQHKETQAVQVAVLVTVAVRLIQGAQELLDKETMVGKVELMVHQAAVVEKTLLDRQVAQAAAEMVELV